MVSKKVVELSGEHKGMLILVVLLQTILMAIISAHTFCGTIDPIKLVECKETDGLEYQYFGC